MVIGRLSDNFPRLEVNWFKPAFRLLEPLFLSPKLETTDKRSFGKVRIRLLVAYWLFSQSATYYLSNKLLIFLF